MGATFLGAALAISVCAQSAETVRLEQRSFYPKVREGWTSSRGYAAPVNMEAGWRTYDDFTFPSAETLSGFQWFGYFRDFDVPANNPVTPTVSQWTITIHADDDGRPGAALFSQTVPGADIQSQEVGLLDFLDLGQLSYRKFEITFATPFLAEAGHRYWISPQAHMPSHNPAFGWYGGVADRLEGHRIYTGNGMSWQAPEGFFETQGFPAEPVLGDRAMVFIGQPANDTDGDGIDDAWEEEHGLDPTRADGHEDPDDDGSDNFREFELQSDPNHPDTDRDGLRDGVETNDGHYVDAGRTGTSPLHADTDGDRLSDAQEVPGADPVSLNGVADTDPNQADTDADGYDDALELANGFDPRDPASLPAIQVMAGLQGGDLTDPKDDGSPANNQNYNAIFAASRGASFTGEGAFNVFDNRLGAFGDDGFGIEPTAFPWSDWVQADLDAPHVLTHFTLASESSFPNGSWDPHIWAIEGSNDGGQTWDVIFLRDNGAQSVWTGRSQVIRFDAGLHYPMPPAYRSFRFFNDRLEERWGLRLGELELFGQPHQCRITGVRRDQDGAIHLEWTSIPGVTYGIEESDDLLTWREMVPSCPSGGTQTTHVVGAFPEPVLGTRFFRVREQ